MSIFALLENEQQKTLSQIEQLQEHIAKHPAVLQGLEQQLAFAKEQLTQINLALGSIAPAPVAPAPVAPAPVASAVMTTDGAVDGSLGAASGATVADSTSAADVPVQVMMP